MRFYLIERKCYKHRVVICTDLILFLASLVIFPAFLNKLLQHVITVKNMFYLSLLNVLKIVSDFQIVRKFKNISENAFTKSLIIKNLIVFSRTNMTVIWQYKYDSNNICSKYCIQLNGETNLILSCHILTEILFSHFTLCERTNGKVYEVLDNWK